MKTLKGISFRITSKDFGGSYRQVYTRTKQVNDKDESVLIALAIKFLQEKYRKSLSNVERLSP